MIFKNILMRCYSSKSSALDGAAGLGAGGTGGAEGFKLSIASKESPNAGLGAPGIAAGGGIGAPGLGTDGKTGGGAAGGAPAGLSPGAVTDGICPEISASKMPAAGTGFGETGAAGVEGVVLKD